MSKSVQNETLREKSLEEKIHRAPVTCGKYSFIWSPRKGNRRQENTWRNSGWKMFVFEQSQEAQEPRESDAKKTTERRLVSVAFLPSPVRCSRPLRTVARQAPLFVGFSGHEHWGAAMAIAFSGHEHWGAAMAIAYSEHEHWGPPWPSPSPGTNTGGPPWPSPSPGTNTGGGHGHRLLRARTLGGRHGHRLLWARTLGGRHGHRLLRARTLGAIRGISRTQGLNPRLLCLLHWQADSSPLSHLGSPSYSKS